jgi:phosphatidate phosphatase APP1
MAARHKLLARIVARADTIADRTRLRVRKRLGADRPLVIVPYIGFGTAARVQLSGRVLVDEGISAASAHDSAWRNVVRTFELLESDEVPGARVRAQLGGTVAEVSADDEGYFSIELNAAAPIEPGWHAVQLDLLEPASSAGGTVRTQGQVLVPPPGARFAVISDIDDTVVWTNVTRRLKMLAMLARSNAHTRKPFKGVAAFYRALQAGAGGADGNPIFYVSSSPWNLYVPLVEYLNVQQIPLGPLLLKDFGDHTLFAMRDHHGHKLACIESILQTYPQLPFVLIGDSGEQDPEIYSEVVRRFPQRVRAIYIRSVDPDPSRIEAIDRLILQVRQSGAQLVLAPDSEYAATHAAGEGWIAPAALGAVRDDKRADERAPAPRLRATQRRG